MANTEVMKWFVRQFLAGNYKFERTVTVQEPTGGEPVSSSLTP